MRLFFYRFILGVCSIVFGLSGHAQDGILYNEEDLEEAWQAGHMEAPIFSLLTEPAVSNRAFLKKELHQASNALFQKQFTRALTHIMHADSAERVYPDSTIQVRILNLYGTLYVKQGELVDGVRYFEKALEHNKTAKNWAGVAKSYHNIATVRCRQGFRKEAEVLFDKALERARYMRQQSIVARCYYGKSLLALNASKLDTAIYYMHEAARIYRAKDNHLALSTTLLGLGGIYYGQQQFDRAEAYYKQALRWRKSVGASMYIANAYNALAQVYYQKMDYGSARNNALQALHLADSVGLAEEAYAARQQLANIEEADQNLTAALHHTKMMLLIRDSIHSTSKARATGRLQERYEAEKRGLVQRLKAKQDQEKLRADQAAVERLRQQIMVSGVLGCVIIGFLLNNMRIRRKTTRTLQQKNRRLEEQKRTVSYYKENLEILVDQRTKELQTRNQQLQRYAYLNAHHVRGPLSNILGLVELYESGVLQPEEYDYFLRALAQSAHQLDHEVYQISQTLKKDQDESSASAEEDNQEE